MTEHIRSYQAAHNVCTVIWRYSEEIGEVEFLVLESRTTHKGQTTEWRTKFPGGGQEGPKETIDGTRDREVWQETGLAIQKSALIWRKRVCESHVKIGFLALFEDCTGSLRTETMIDGDDELRPPRWKRVSDLKHELFDSHQALLIKAMIDLNLR